mmetsp:Transcript_70/g.112  ORF Transcript_70/g.112 Transcript_70/m.112 type:complete len:245 (+) Transcript_70:33-767(+)
MSSLGLQALCRVSMAASSEGLLTARQMACGSWYALLTATAQATCSVHQQPLISIFTRTYQTSSSLKSEPGDADRVSADASNQQPGTDAGAADSSPTTSSTSTSVSSTSDSSMAFGPRRVLKSKQARAQAEILQGIVHINNSSNNIILALTDTLGKVKAVKSAGSAGYRNARKSLPVAAERTADALAKVALEKGYSSVVVKMKGVGQNKQLAAQTLHAAGLNITELIDVTPVPYNGCRLSARRRI